MRASAPVFHDPERTSGASSPGSTKARCRRRLDSTSAGRELAAHGGGLGRALVALGDETELDRSLPPLAEPRRGLVDLCQRGQARFVAEMLDRMRGCRARELEVLLPLGIGIDQIRIDIGTVKDVAGAVGVDG